MKGLLINAQIVTDAKILLLVMRVKNKISKFLIGTTGITPTKTPIAVPLAKEIGDPCRFLKRLYNL